MPVYEFKCDDCGEVISEIRKFDEIDPPLCTNCGSKKTKKVFSAFSSGKVKTSSPSCAPSGGG